ncbi:hypothetical protein KKF34_11690 [Myxococcota bacterium]|nr:hypothetical protein [Myxococcota bacterium]MBU1381519.1 hypothetical protein [Myxococcota bacterium]MBU1497526.1 hypothetical protein [Myxococcota bacterium]
MRVSKIICAVFTVTCLLSTTSTYAQTKESDGSLPPLVGSEPATKDATATPTVVTKTEKPASPSTQPENPSAPANAQPEKPTEPQPAGPVPVKTVVVKKEIPHLKSFAAAISWRNNFDSDGPVGGAMFSLYYFPSYYLGLEISIFNIVSATFKSPEYGDRGGFGSGVTAMFFPFKYNPVGYSYYLKAGAVYEQVDYVIEPKIDENKTVNYFGFEAGAGVMFTLGSTLSVGFEATFLGSFTGDDPRPFEPEAAVGPFDRAALVLKLYLMARWNLVHWVQGSDGKFRDANREL